MRAMADVTFRDFAGAVMRGDLPAAASVLQVLLGLAPAAATAATAHFQAQMMSGGPAFMGKAMGLRTAVTSGSDIEIGALLADCFALAGPAITGAVAALRTKYPAA
jgi:hypothetical protein